MKKIIPILIIGSIFSQDNNKLGFGFSFDVGNPPIMNLIYGNVLLTPTLYLSKDFIEGKIEPSISYYSETYSSAGFGREGTKETNSITEFGIGYIKKRKKYEKYNTYWGGRFAIATGSAPRSTIHSFSPIYGAEYHSSDNFSLGGETRVNYAYKVSDNENNLISISAHLFFRFYN